MRQDDRRRKYEIANQASSPEPSSIDIYIESLMKNPSSEHRIENIASGEVSNFHAETSTFESEKNLKVVLVNMCDEIPKISEQTDFKYSVDGLSNILSESVSAMKGGEKLIIALVKEEELIIGYGTARLEDNGSEIEIIDVDTYSRRKNGLVHPIQVSGKEFQIGIGHVIVKKLIDECIKPIKVDATNSQSRYIFKSLGFVHDDETGNPCILRFD
jgi:hypothetical protein